MYNKDKVKLPSIEIQEKVCKDYIENNMTTKELQKKYKLGSIKITKILRVNNIKAKTLGDYKNNLVNKKFNYLTVIARDYNKRPDNRRYWFCECICGNSTSVSTNNLIGNSVLSCGCHSGNNSNRFLKKLHNKDMILDTYYNRLRWNATKRQIKFDIHRKDIYDLFLNQNGICKLSGIHISLPTCNSKQYDAGSIDRINSTIGYTTNNIQWVYKDINKIKRSLSNENFISICGNVCYPCSPFDYVDLGIPKYYLCSIKCTAKKRNLKFDLDIPYLENLFKQQNNTCAYTGRNISFNNKTASLDRTDSSQGYIKGNVQWVLKDINLMKWEFSVSHFIYLCKLVSQFQNPTLYPYTYNGAIIYSL